VRAHQLVKPPFLKDTVPVLIDVHSVGRPRSLAVDEHTERDRLTRRPRSQHEVHIARQAPR
jgi:hypothetical protein